MAKVAIVVPNYNMPEAVSALMAALHSDVSHDWIVVDNGSDIAEPHPRTAVRLPKNTGGMNGAVVAGLEYASGRYSHYWILTTSMVGIECEGDPLELLLSHFNNPDVVAVSPGWTGNMLSWPHRYMQTDGEIRETPLIAAAALWRADWLDRVGFCPHLRDWGTDFELSYLARQNGLRMVIDGRVTVEIREGHGYDEGRRLEDLIEHRQRSREQMEQALTERYGSGWQSILLEGIVQNV